MTEKPDITATDPATIDPAALRERMAQWKRYNAFQDEERRQKQDDPERLGREWLMMIAVQRRLVREGVGTAPSDWEEHMAWSRVQKALMGRNDEGR